MRDVRLLSAVLILSISVGLALSSPAFALRAGLEGREPALAERLTAGAEEEILFKSPSWGDLEVPASGRETALSSMSIDFSKWGPVLKKRLTPLRKTVGERMVESWTEVPHVTQFADADITGLMEIRKRHVARFKKKGGSLTVTVFAIKVVLDALKKYPLANASLDEATEEVVFKNYYHIGIAVDTEAGLIVPVLKDVDKKNLLDLSVELVALAEKARKRKLALEELQGASFTISNLGSIGGTHFTPIVYKPQVAILGIGRGALRPVWTRKRFEPRTLLPLALSYDHRVIDGADGARFITEIVSGFENFDARLLSR